MPITAGIISDTHIPDRAKELHPLILPILQEAGVKHIFHAGDISTPKVLDQLSLVAPVTAVRGNRDVLLPQLNMVEEVDLEGTRVVVLHGHGSLLRYLWDKMQFILFGYQRKRYLKLITGASKTASVIVFGHTHYPELFWHKGKLIINPGSACSGFYQGWTPSLALLHIRSNGEVNAELINLEGYKIQNWKWVKENSAG